MGCGASSEATENTPKAESAEEQPRADRRSSESLEADRLARRSKVQQGEDQQTPKDWPQVAPIPCACSAPSSLIIVSARICRVPGPPHWPCPSLGWCRHWEGALGVAQPRPSLRIHIMCLKPASLAPSCVVRPHLSGRCKCIQARRMCLTERLQLNIFNATPSRQRKRSSEWRKRSKSVSMMRLLKSCWAWKKSSLQTRLHTWLSCGPAAFRKHCESTKRNQRHGFLSRRHST